MERHHHLARQNINLMNFGLPNVAHHCPFYCYSCYSICFVKRTGGDHVGHNTTHEHRWRVELCWIQRNFARAYRTSIKEQNRCWLWSSHEIPACWNLETQSWWDRLDSKTSSPSCCINMPVSFSLVNRKCCGRGPTNSSSQWSLLQNVVTYHDLSYVHCSPPHVANQCCNCSCHQSPCIAKKANIVETSRVNIPSQQHTAACSCLKLRMSPTLQVIWSSEVGPKKNSQPQNENKWPFPRTFSPPPTYRRPHTLGIWNFGCSQCMRVRQATDSGQQSSGSEESASRAGFVYNGWTLHHPRSQS
jgi:hypothetical protein